MKYPRIRDSFARPRNTSAKCPCGKVGQYRSDIQVNEFRGDDEVVWRCKEHRYDVDVKTVTEAEE